jgi:hypothetical protein
LTKCNGGSKLLQHLCTDEIDVCVNDENLHIQRRNHADKVSNANATADFRAVSRHILRLTGDIPALPIPLHFDLDEPVDLLIATDGSVLFGVGYHGWVLTTKYETILLRGGGPDDGIQLLLTSYRSELGGLVAGLAVMGTLFCEGTINIQAVRFLCDNESAVTADRRPETNSIFHNTKCDWDLIMTIQDLIV